MEGKTRNEIIVAIALLLIITTPPAYAYSTGISPLNDGVAMISNMFNLEVLRTNEAVQTGFLKLVLFIMIFSIFNMILKKLGGGNMFDKKTAGIIAFSFSAIGVFFMPLTWLQATGGAIAAIVSSIVFLGIFLGLSYVAMFQLKDDWLRNLFGLLLLLLLLFLLNTWVAFTGLPVQA